MDKKPELLAPAGNTEAFYAAMESGADAVYLGLKDFNSRARAMNFSLKQLPAVLMEARKKGIKIYITLNTVIKNRELPLLINQLQHLQVLRPDALIIQDWGVAYLVRKYFPEMQLHASTQMGIHNSNGVNHAGALGFGRVICARELTMKELALVAKRTQTELEVFIHGALCYSISGMCLFSSYLGGASANRGLCTQPCRRFFKAGENQEAWFSLKDNQQIKQLQKLRETGIASLKIEGRMKSASYVSQVTQIYRTLLDNPQKAESTALLPGDDMGREKTDYFLGGNLKNAITKIHHIGTPIGKVIQADGKSIQFDASITLTEGMRLIITDTETNLQKIVRLTGAPVSTQGNLHWLCTEKISAGSSVFLVSLREKKFPSRLPNIRVNHQIQIDNKLKNNILNQFKSDISKENKEEIFLRINNPEWGEIIRMEYINGLILRLSAKQRKFFPESITIEKSQRHKIWLELPKFISENTSADLADFCQNAVQMGYQKFILSHIGQKKFLPANTQFATNENVYVYNDAAAKLISEEGAEFWTSPYENELENLLSGHNRNAMIALYYYPELFYSRMPVKIPSGHQAVFSDEQGRRFFKKVSDGITVVLPEIPVALFQNKDHLKNHGFSKFMIDLNWVEPSARLLKKVMLRMKNSEQLHPSTTFNFRKGLK
ncbi:MAG: U32 family peptidase [Bacteroidales bacterium]|nr:U32 family peptidase [Bacteroidales bacterium]MDD3010636.1 U32 family peptidase [Bacteroidales bacterium]MDY0285265.1 peptidase U32 family protein [Bacteroidales bacterium]HPE86918.1 peptidase U32 family protein [Bacteroidales bacterium]